MSDRGQVVGYRALGAGVVAVLAWRGWVILGGGADPATAAWWPLLLMAGFLVAESRTRAARERESGRRASRRATGAAAS